MSIRTRRGPFRRQSVTIFAGLLAIGGLLWVALLNVAKVGIVDSHLFPDRIPGFSHVDLPAARVNGPLGYEQTLH